VFEIPEGKKLGKGGDNENSSNQESKFDFLATHHNVRVNTSAGKLIGR